MVSRTLLLLALVGCASKTPNGPVPAPLEVTVSPRTDASAGVSDPTLASLLEEHWDLRMQRSPFWATRLGDRRYDDRLGSVSAAQQAREEAEDDALRVRAEALVLSGRDNVVRQVLVAGLRSEVAVRTCDVQSWSFSPRQNPLAFFNSVAELHPVRTPEDGANLVARIQAMPSYLDDVILNLRRGAGAGRFNNATSTRLVLQMIADQLEQPLAEWPMLAPLAEDHPEWTEAQVAGFHAALTEAVDGGVRPALVLWGEVLREEILPSARADDAPGLASLPGGEICYAALLQRFTTLPDRDAAFIHAQGLAQLESVHAEFRALGVATLGTDEVSAIFARLRTDPALRFESEEQVEAKALSALERAQEVVPPAFGLLPRAKCVVKRVPAYQAPYTTIAYYRQPVPDGSQPGAYYVNVYEPETRPRFEAEVLAYHEAVPGHHLQIAIAQELPDTPSFLRYAGMTAFVEGWALYSERLADELGLYSTDLDRLGMLSYDAWRSARLAVDTGLHDLGWSRQEAIDFMLANTPLAENNIVNEVDRYITTPGQALAYKTGQLEILRLRALAEQELGDEFVLADFHDVVLGSGAVTLPVLESLVVSWIEAAHGP